MCIRYPIVWPVLCILLFPLTHSFAQPDPQDQGVGGTTVSTIGDYLNAAETTPFDAESSMDIDDTEVWISSRLKKIDGKPHKIRVRILSKIDPPRPELPNQHSLRPPNGSIWWSLSTTNEAPPAVPDRTVHEHNGVRWYVRGSATFQSHDEFSELRKGREYVIEGEIRFDSVRRSFDGYLLTIRINNCQVTESIAAEGDVPSGVGLSHLMSRVQESSLPLEDQRGRMSAFTETFAKAVAEDLKQFMGEKVEFEAMVSVVSTIGDDSPGGYWTVVMRRKNIQEVPPPRIWEFRGVRWIPMGRVTFADDTEYKKVRWRDYSCKVIGKIGDVRVVNQIHGVQLFIDLVDARIVPRS